MSYRTKAILLAVVLVLVGTAAADVTGFLAASVIAGLGLIIIPARKRKD